MTCCDPSKKPAVFTEQNFSDPNLGGAYERSKTRAELAAWEFVANQPAEQRIELSVCTPAFILGPTEVMALEGSGRLMTMFMAS